MQRDVAVVGYAHTELTPEIGKSRERVIFDLTSEFFSSKGMTRDDVETFIFASNDFCDGRTISNVFIDDPAGVYMKDETKVESDGTNAVLYALMRILSGQYENALVIGMGLTGSEARTYMMTDYILDPTYDRQMGIMNELSTAALQAHAYLGRYGLDDKVLDAVAARNLRCAASNPRAMSRVDEADEGKVASSPFLYEPLRELHCYPPTDGACVILLASGDRAGAFL